MTDAQELRRMFLENAARNLFALTPATSKQLMLEHHEVGFSTSAYASPEMCAYCSACGSILLPQWTMDITFTTKQIKIIRKVGGEKILRSKIRSQRCRKCRRITRTRVQIPHNRNKSKPELVKAPQTGQEEITSLDAGPETETTSKQSSKKRAKGRKDREGLRALLNKSVQSRTAPSLNLTDLMKR
jgi:hypothetical protein